MVYEQLYELIQTLELPPGERLVEADLSSRFGISKTPIREALLLLEKEGLVQLVPHLGATVTWLSLHDYEQHLFLQDALEQPALPLVVEHLGPEGRERCIALAGAIQQARGRGEDREFQRLVIRMHTELFGLAGYPRLTQMIDVVQRALRRYHPVFVEQFEENRERELAIVLGRVEHVLRGDPSGAAAAVQQGHREMLEFARELVRNEDPRVMPYLRENERQPILRLPV